jgi:hypothetical protein
MTRSISCLVLGCGLLALAAASEGCQRKSAWNLVPVEGTVTKNGRSLAGMQVVFMADVDAGTQGPKTSGVTDESGHYRLRTDNGDDGAVVGKHRVLIHDLHVVMKQRKGSRIGPLPKKGKQPLPKPLEFLKDQSKSAPDAPWVPPRYGRFDQTPLRVEVHPGPQTLDFDIH